MRIIVGSTALKHFGYNVKPQDLDVWSDVEIDKVQGVDSKVLPTDLLRLVTHSDGYATPNSCYTIKCSHLGWSNPRWNKHKVDVLMLKHKGCKIIEPLYERLVDFWKIELGDKSFLSLSKNKGDFFNDNVKYYYDHDYLHELVAFPRKPMYTCALKDGEDVMIDKRKFQLLSFEERVRMFREEITVIAFERWLIPQKLSGKTNYTWNQAYDMALQKTITTLTKGWATDFIVRNLEKFSKPDFSYFKHTMEEIIYE
jgi:hypothetical protein